MNDGSSNPVGARFIAPAPRARKALRLRRYNYASPGYYFVTACCAERRCVLGEVRDGDVVPSKAGFIVSEYWMHTVARFPSVASDAFVLMPNHVHGILQLGKAGAINRAPTFGEVVRSFKASVSRATSGLVPPPLWQRGFYERVVRDDYELSRIREYVANNPRQWSIDRENPDRSLN